MRSLGLPVRYLGWMARDVARGPGLFYLAIAALFSYLAGQSDAPRTAAAAGDALRNVVGQFSWMVVLVATAGMVASDVSKGFYRSMFAEPVTPAGYYLQRWLVGALAVGAFVPLVGAGIFAALGSFPFSPALLTRLMLLYLLLGGLVFLLSTVLRSDWLIALLLFVLQTALQAAQRGGVELGIITRNLARALPPFHLGSITTTYPSSLELTHALLYGLGLVVTAMVVLTHRPMGSGGRA